MKTINTLLTITVCTGFLFLNSLIVNGQNCKCPDEVLVVYEEPAMPLVSITEKDYPNFLNISGLERYSNIKYLGSTKNSKSYTLKSKSNQVNLNATYAQDGKLIHGKLTVKNAPLPKIISRHLASDDYKNWIMKSNKTVIHDFDALKTEYEIKLQQDKKKQTLYFNHKGDQIKKLSRRL
ncbi:hypothetical protein LQ318_03940 [Aliifodinibius salicampi]|uniref:Beta-lactamase-inhibitor-like, PepSY-like n=1 Tax=Fodinibius salicampi TaxID=1920655 RepID=A0ABT3PW47_9BACT|nr:hypothetical protein [Fodinibius salicampi]MCW9712048.1 hypothetical protein [Fodinibius salicampi]